MKARLSSVLGQNSQSIKFRSDEEAKLEKLLTEQMAPITPRTAYINDLGRRLSDRAQPIVVQGHSRVDEFGLWQGMLLITVGVISGILLVVLGTRFLASIFNSRQTVLRGTDS